MFVVWYNVRMQSVSFFGGIVSLNICTALSLITSAFLFLHIGSSATLAWVFCNMVSFLSVKSTTWYDNLWRYSYHLRFTSLYQSLSFTLVLYILHVACWYWFKSVIITVIWSFNLLFRITTYRLCLLFSSLYQVLIVMK